MSEKEKVEKFEFTWEVYENCMLILLLSPFAAGLFILMVLIYNTFFK